MSDKMQSIGALWKKYSERTGNEYFTGDIDIPGGGTIKIVAFNNDRKEKESQPDIRIYLSDKQPDRGRGSSGDSRGLRPGYASGGSRPEPAPKPRPQIEYPKEDIDPDDIPF